MFLTNNYRTVSNLLLYSKCNYAYRTLSTKKNTEISKFLHKLKGAYSSHIKCKELNTKLILLSYSLEPYGNINEYYRIIIPEFEELTKNFKVVEWNLKN